METEFSRQYLQILKTKFAGLNLTRILQEEEFHYKQVVDSLLPLEHLKGFREEILRTGLLVDVGFGGGFPLLPLAKELPEVCCVGLEARGKKAAAVKQIAQEFKLANAHPIHKRLEDVLWDRECVVTFKAVGKVKECLAKIKTRVPITVLFYKGVGFDEQEGSEGLPQGWKLRQRAEVELSGTRGRVLLLYRGQNVPHGTKPLKKNLANLTHIVEQFLNV